MGYGYLWILQVNETMHVKIRVIDKKYNIFIITLSLDVVTQMIFLQGTFSNGTSGLGLVDEYSKFLL